eukprot:CAMPEP_0181495956 /NCGR_PEP_ID=MMETSP1110-20121109/52691_1 /TAXON_ID=174948 /ORGANISM="Symbiodinium sp., Strain CCMP421" /LENGTH=67 /DNA_ID=CAMNT_0023623689 /DNA_START=88 /DNA_END=287 /DNA_ORIENTATION=-
MTTFLLHKHGLCQELLVVVLMAVQLALLPRRVANGLWIRPGTQAIVEVHEAGHGEIKITAGEATAAG